MNARCLFSLAVAHGFLYTIGGQFGKKSLQLVGRHDADANAWEKVSPLKLKTPRSAPAVAVHRNFISIVGGATKYNPSETATVERYDGDSVNENNNCNCTMYNVHTDVYIYKIYMLTKNRWRILILPATSSLRTLMRNKVTQSSFAIRLIIIGGNDDKGKHTDYVE